MTIRLYNTLTRSKEVFRPGDPERVTMYVCGPTVYNYAHIGNARPAVVFDVLYRLLKANFPNVVYVRNITDIDDKIIDAAAASGEPIEQITARYAEIYRQDMAALKVLPPDVEPHATGHMPDMIAMIETLIARGHAYEADGHVLFDVTSYQDYGRLSHRSLKEMEAGARVEVAEYKRNPGDFVLWKPSTGDQPGWNSPWGFGRPGWHIECSAMSSRHLGTTIDIHGGGIDLVFPHHENELAQSVCAHGQEFVRCWVHNGFLTVDRDKMSKSIGNILTVHDLLDEVPGEVLRLVLLSAHYRQPLDWSDETIRQARERLDRIYRTLRELADVELPEDGLDPPPELEEALADDLNTPNALGVLAGYVNRANATDDPSERRRLKAAILGSGHLLGLLNEEPEAWLQSAPGERGVDAAAIEALIADRASARSRKDWAEADRIRDQLGAMGVIIEDSAGETRWRVAN